MKYEFESYEEYSWGALQNWYKAGETTSEGLDISKLATHKRTVFLTIKTQHGETEPLIGGLK